MGPLNNCTVAIYNHQRASPKIQLSVSRMSACLAAFIGPVVANHLWVFVSSPKNIHWM